MTDNDWVAEMLNEISCMAGAMSEQERLHLLESAVEAVVERKATEVIGGTTSYVGTAVRSAVNRADNEHVAGLPRQA